MRRPLETARRWLAETTYSLEVTRLMFDNGLWSDVCFKSEHTSQLALKAYLYGTGKRTIYMHSIGDLLSECGQEDEDFIGLRGRGVTLDKNYLSSRYPDALPPPAIPFESLTADEAHQALGIATEIVEMVRARIGEAGPESWLTGIHWQRITFSSAGNFH